MTNIIAILHVETGTTRAGLWDDVIADSPAITGEGAEAEVGFYSIKEHPTQLIITVVGSDLNKRNLSQTHSEWMTFIKYIKEHWKVKDFTHSIKEG